MKKLIAFLTLAGILSFGFTNMVIAQEDVQAQTEETNDVVAEADSLEAAVADQVATLEENVEVDKGFHQILKEQFIAGNAGFMGIVLLALIFGLALSVERIIYLNLSTTNTKKLLNKVETALQNGGVDGAKEVCKDTKGPVASIFWQGLHKYEDGLDVVEKSIVAFGGVLMGRLEKGLSWIALFIALAPMLGFMGTVIGMIGAFADIAAAGNISATVVASGIQVALLTTVFGLIVAIILQVFYNYLVAKIDSIVNDMEDSTIEFVDILSNFKSGK
ncbi:MAG: MotA/TolQ/ExbB proton channel family protein [Bacteroidales bacterium]|jgi:biopolymer transport protein ExbB|nr:MotA/TolQ/ExbB proton channel family protein [Bacteroidales bacterium]